MMGRWFLKYMPPKGIKIFIKSAGVLLAITGAAKIVSACSSAKIFMAADPVLFIPFRYVFFAAGVIELVVAFLCLGGKSVKLPVFSLVWLTTSFVIYRIGWHWVCHQHYCPCLGTLTDALHISPGGADLALKIVLAYLLAGSYAAFIFLWWQNRGKTPPSNLAAAR